MTHPRVLACGAIVVGMAVAAHVRPAVAATGPLDGRTFVGESGEKGKAKGEREEIVFKGGTLHSVPCDAWGFGSAPYTATAAAGVTTFEAVTTSAKEGEIHWKGTVKGDQLEGTFVWKKKGQADIEYWTRATLKK
jgi:hypothetical protein